MSEYTSYSYSYRPSVVAQALAGGSKAFAAVGSAAVVSVAALFKAVGEKARELEAGRLTPSEAWLGAIKTEPLVCTAMSDVLPEFPRLLEKLETGKIQPQDLPAVQEAFTAARSRMLKSETAVLREHLAGALTEMGYAISQPRRPLRDSMMLRGSRPDGTAFAATIAPKTGQLEIDLSGFSGQTCEQESARLIEHLRRRGVMLQERATQRHGRRSGGALTARVAAEMGCEAKPASVSRRIKERN